MSANIKKWEERLKHQVDEASFLEIDNTKNAEIAELRAEVERLVLENATYLVIAKRHRSALDQWEAQDRAALAAKTEGATDWVSVPQPWNDLYVAVNHLMIQLGAHGEIESRSTESLGVMSALSGIVGGTVSARALELHEKAHMPLFQATALALRECGVPAVQQGGEAVAWCVQNPHGDGVLIYGNGYALKPGDQLYKHPAAPHPVMDDKSATQDIGCEPPAPPCEYCGSTSECDQSIPHPPKHGKGDVA